MKINLVFNPFDTAADKPVPWNESSDNWAAPEVIVSTPSLNNVKKMNPVFLILLGLILFKIYGKRK
jgi:hypothetical protein